MAIPVLLAFSPRQSLPLFAQVRAVRCRDKAPGQFAGGAEAATFVTAPRFL